MPQKKKPQRAAASGQRVRFRYAPTGLAAGLGLGSVLWRFHQFAPEALRPPWVPRVSRVARNLGNDMKLRLLAERVNYAPAKYEYTCEKRLFSAINIPRARSRKLPSSRPPLSRPNGAAANAWRGCST